MEGLIHRKRGGLRLDGVGNRILLNVFYFVFLNLYIKNINLLEMVQVILNIQFLHKSSSVH